MLPPLFPFSLHLCTIISPGMCEYNGCYFLAWYIVKVRYHDMKHPICPLSIIWADLVTTTSSCDILIPGVERNLQRIKYNMHLYPHQVVGILCHKPIGHSVSALLMTTDTYAIMFWILIWNWVPRNKGELQGENRETSKYKYRCCFKQYTLYNAYSCHCFISKALVSTRVCEKG